jgi:hypothetical protein
MAPPLPPEDGSDERRVRAQRAQEDRPPMDSPSTPFDAAGTQAVYPEARAAWLARAGLAALVLLLFRELLQGGVVFDRDVHLIWHPQVEAFVRAVAAGALPLWDPSPAFGQPLLADPGAQVLYPPSWLNLVLRPWTYYTAFAIGHVLFSGWAFLGLLRRWGVSTPAATLGAATWAAGGPLLSLVTLWHHFASASWIPAVLLAAERALASRRRRDLALLAAALGLQVLAGSPDMCAMTLLTVAAMTIGRQLSPTGLRELPRLAAGGAVALLAATALSAGQWVASLALLLRSGRAALPDAIRTYWSLHPGSLLEAVVPGVPGQLPLQVAARQALFEGREPFLPSLYLGLPALALVVIGLAGPGSRRLRLGLGLLLAGATLVALGRHTPAYELAVAVIPPLQVLRYPVKATIFAAFAWSGLAALGLDVWLRGRLERRWRVVAMLALALALLVLAVIAVQLRPPLRAWTSQVVLPAGAPWLAQRLGLHGALGVAMLGLLALGVRTASRVTATAVLAPLVVVLDLALAHARPSPAAPLELYTHRPGLLRALEPLGAPRVYSYDYARPGAALEHLGAPHAHLLARYPAGWSAGAASALGLQMSLAPQTPGRWGLRQGFDADYRGLQPRPNALLTQAARLVEGRPDEILRLLQVGAVSHVLAMHQVAAGRLRPTAEEPGLYARPTTLFEVPGALPRVRVVAGARVADEAQAIALLLDRRHDPARFVVLAQGRAAEPPAHFDGRAAIVGERADALEVEAEISAAGYLVVADSWDPGWSARVDGVPVEVLRADLAFRAVALPAGRHRVELAYRPREVLWALAISALTAVGLVVSAAVLAVRGAARRHAG